MRVRNVFFLIHLVLGLSVGAFFLLMGLSGATLVFADGLDERLNPTLLRVEPRGERMPLQRALETVRSGFPGMTVANIRLPEDERTAFVFSVRGKGDAALEVAVDPYSGRMLGQRDGRRSLLGWIADFHKHLLAGRTGETVIGCFGLAALALLVTGVLIWLPGKNGSFRNQFKASLSGGWRKKAFTWHRLVGIVVFAFLTVSAVTGAAMVFDDVVGKWMSALAGTPFRMPRPASGEPVAEGTPKPLDELLAVAEQALPGGRTTYVFLSPKAADPISFRKRLDGEWHMKGRSTVFVNPLTGAVIRADDARSLPRGVRWFNALYPIHTGQWGGMVMRSVLVLLGVAPGFLFLTGFFMWWTRVMRRRSAAAR